MIDARGLCPSCFAKIGTAEECARCGYIKGTPQIAPFLRQGTVLANRFMVGKRISVNGEGVSYLALDLESGKKVTVREFLPGTLCTRGVRSDEVQVNIGEELVFSDYMEDFLEIHKAVGHLSDIPAIVPVIDIFECNNTAYAVYEKVDGRPLTDIIRKAERLTWDEARPLFIPLISALISAHAIGLVHFGINPGCVYLTREGRLKVDGFGIPDARFEETELKAEIFDGYSAIEQYSLDGKKGQASDVYAVSALLFFILTGKRPTDAVTRAYEPRLNVPSDLAKQIPSHVITSIAGGLQVMPEKRTSTLEQLKQELTVRAGAAAGGSIAGEAAVHAAAMRSGDSRQSRPVRRPIERASAAQRDDREQSNAPFSFINALANLSQLQLGLLSAAVATVILGIIAVIILNAVKGDLANNDGFADDLSSVPMYVSSADLADENQTTYVFVPDLVGKKWSEVKDDAQYTAFDMMCIEEIFSDDYASGFICEQTIAAESAVAPGTPLGVKVSIGSQMRKIPKIVGKSVAEADEMLTEAGLLLGSQSEEYSDDVEAGCIIEIVGSSVGKKLEYGSYVNVKISLGPEPVGGVVEE